MKQGNEGLAEDALAAGDSTIDGQALHSLEGIAADTARLSSLQQLLVDAVCEVLKLPEVSVDADLFVAHGLQSLTALRIVFAVQAQNVEVTIEDIYMQRTIGALTQHLALARADITDTEEPA